MARPTLGTSASLRLHMVITEDELTAIDDWRFANRVASRSEAVRHLCSLALAMGLIPDDIHTIEQTQVECGDGGFHELNMRSALVRGAVL